MKHCNDCQISENEMGTKRLCINCTIEKYAKFNVGGRI